MGIPVRDLVETKGQVNVVDCVGCGRCVTTCPQNALRFYDVRDRFRKIPPPEKSGLLDDEELDEKEVRIAASIAEL
jgi:ferredoxin